MNRTRIVVIGYVPLLRPAKSDEMPIVEGKDCLSYLKKLGLDDINQAGNRAKFCAWGMENGEFLPVFGLERSKEIAEHLKWYSEGKPEEWFDLFIRRLGKKYGIVLMPRMSKMIERFKANYLHTKGEFLVDEEFNVLFRPLSFMSNDPSKTFDQVKISNKMRLHILEIEDFDVANGGFKSEPIDLGAFNVKTTGEVDGLFDEDWAKGDA